MSSSNNQKVYNVDSVLAELLDGNPVTDILVNETYKIVDKISFRKGDDRFIVKVERDGKLFALKYWRFCFEICEGEFDRQLKIFETLKEKEIPHILYPVDSGKDTKGGFMVFEYIECRLPPTEYGERFWNFLAKVAEAIDGVHNNNIVHTDIKLGNILYTKNEEVYLIDFENAFFYPETNDSPQDVGTLHYMAPEVAKNSYTSNNFPRDVWAFGVLVYRLFFGAFPFSWVLEQDDEKYDEYVDKENEVVLLKDIKETIPGLMSENIFRNKPIPKLMVYLFLKIAVIKPNQRPKMSDVRRYIELKLSQSEMSSLELSFSKYQNI
eukprot:TRINITY_DN4550_c2_g1_i2.p1 TRINITY_DN4550_c2_g1~~TRINITY_DN4550_c2_g1_i2.p1  ORF type:complete len:323 (+),score=59.38 TRINITY_DN4550_c2_g1_i2:468-1436(+)